jgi:hypothetical protein
MTTARTGRVFRPLAAIAAIAGIAACSGQVGPYVRNIEVTPDGAVIVERCTTVTTDYGFVTTLDNESTWCDKNVLPIQTSQAGGAQGATSSASPPFAATPAGPQQPPLPAASPASVQTPSGAGPGTVASTAPSEAPARTGIPVSGGGLCPQGMALIPHGSFSMGERKDRVKVNRFCIDVTEVTAEAYSTCARIGQCTAEGLACGPAATFNVAGKGEHPINCVDWNQASTYCQAQGKRLPTEEEWEWAARGGTQGKKYPWGNIEPSSQACWSGSGQLSGTCPVGSYPPGANPQGVLDLSGNVWEWTSSRKDDSSTERVARGGAWSSSASSYLRAAERYWTSPLYRFIYIGFRCARTV